MIEMHGRLDGDDLLVTRPLPLSAAQAWAWCTDPALTARWYGPWAGEGRVGGVVDITMSAEEGAPTSLMRVDACDGRGLTLQSLAPAPYDWRVSVEVRDGALALRHHGVPRGILGDVGAGWEFYLDALAAAVEGRPALTFEDCRTALHADYEALS